MRHRAHCTQCFTYFPKLTQQSQRDTRLLLLEGAFMEAILLRRGTKLPQYAIRNQMSVRVPLFLPSMASPHVCLLCVKRS